MRAAAVGLLVALFCVVAVVAACGAVTIAFDRTNRVATRAAGATFCALAAAAGVVAAASIGGW